MDESRPGPTRLRVGARLQDALLRLRDHGYQPMYNGRPSCPFCGGFVDADGSHESGCTLVAAYEADREVSFEAALRACADLGCVRVFWGAKRPCDEYVDRELCATCQARAALGLAGTS